MKALLIALLLLGAASGVGRLQPSLAFTVHETKSREDVYVLPPPRELRLMNLGYDAATIDLLWAKLLVEYGVHHGEKRPFADLEKYIDAIVALDPKYAAIYKYGESMLVYRPPRGYEPDARKARALLETGVKELPDDWRVWQDYGDFLAFVAPSFLTNEEEIERWRGEGADALMRAVSLGGDTRRALSAASLLGKRGERDSQIRQLQKAYHMTENPDERERIAARLGTLHNRQSIDLAERHRKAVIRECDLGAQFLTSRELCLLVGPFPAPAACAGPSSVDSPACARTWATVLEADDARYTAPR